MKHVRASAVLFLAALLASAGARAADSVTLEAGGGQSTPQPTVQPSPFEYQRLIGRYEPTDTFYLSASARLQHDLPSSPTPGTTLRDGDDWVFSATIDLSVDLDKHLTVGLGANGSPSSARDLATQFRATSNAIMHATNSNAGASAELTYDTFDEDAPARTLEGSLDLSLAYSHYWTAQALTEFDLPGGPTSVGDCPAKRQAALCSLVDHAANTADADLGQLRLSANVTATVSEHTDLSVEAAYYLYDQEAPDQVGYYTYTPPGSAVKQTYGAGLPLIPPDWSLRPEVGHRWKVLSARLWYQYTDYTLADYVGHAVGGKAQLYLGKWRVYASGNFRADVSPGGTVPTAQSWTLGLGLTRQF